MNSNFNVPLLVINNNIENNSEFMNQIFDIIRNNIGVILAIKVGTNQRILELFKDLNIFIQFYFNSVNDVYNQYDNIMKKIAEIISKKIGRKVNADEINPYSLS